jgi:hypothetical protein
MLEEEEGGGAYAVEVETVAQHQLPFADGAGLEGINGAV